MTTPPDVKSLFGKALELTTPADRAAFLDEACAGNPALRSEVEGLLHALDRAGSFMNQPGSSAETVALPPLAESAGTIIGPYKLLEQIGEGGMGAVFMAEQTEPVRRFVALKIIKPGLDSAQVVARFEAERQALALMDHPNIAKVLDAGTTTSGRPYFVMELVKGVHITKFCDENRLTPRQRLELFVPVCQAVQHAHTKGVIHRDLKPSNVLIALYDDKPVPKVIDFGVAKATSQKLTERTLFTGFGTFIGTLEYMSPEQAKLNALDIDTRSDVYALGVLLYELLTGSTPLEQGQLKQAALDEVLRLIREEEPPRPSTRLSASGKALAAISSQRGTEPAKLGKVVRGELDWIVMKCLEKDRTRRYETANGLARDVERYLKDEAIEACPPSTGYKLRKFARKHQKLLATAAILAAVLLLGAAVSGWQAVRARKAEADALAERDNAERARQSDTRQRALAEGAATAARASEQKAKEAGEEAVRLARDEKAARKVADEQRLKALSEKQQADEARQKALANETKAEWRLYALQMASAQREWEADNVPLFRHHLELCRRDFRGWEHDYLYTLANPHQPIVPGPIKDTYAYHLAFSADDKRLAIAGPGSCGFANGQGASDVQVWDLASGKKVLTLKDTWGCVAFSPDGARLATGWYDEKLDGIRLDIDGRVKVWDAVSGKEVFSLKGHTGVIRSVVFSADGKRLASTASDGTVKLWDMDSGKEFRTLEHDEGSEFKGRKLPGVVTAAAFSPDGKQLASVGKTVKVWDVASGKELRTFETEAKTMYLKVAFSPDGKRLASALYTWSDNSRVKVWELASGKQVFALKGPTGSFAFSPDGKRLAGGWHLGGMVKVWELTGGQEVFTLKGPSGPLAFSHDGTRVASVSSDGVRIWELAASPDCLTLTGHKSVARGLAFSPDGKLLAAPSSDNTVKLWQVADGREIRTFTGHTDFVTSVAFSPDGKQLASSSPDKTVKLWDAASGKEIRTIQGHTNRVERVGFSPDGKYLASAEASYSRSAPENRLRVWELASGKKVLDTNETAGAVAFSPDSKSVATAFKDVVRVLNVASGKEVMAGKGHASSYGICCVDFSPDGKRLASASRDGTVKVWDLASSQDLMTLKGHTSQVLSVAFSPDGKRLASGSVDKTVKLWDAVSGQEVLALKGHTGPVQSVTFSPDGKRLASASDDFTIKIWDASKSMKEPGQK